MDSGDLRVFEAVARLGAMNRAAEELNTVQSNVTARIRQLEEDLGATLFHRHSRGVELSAAGRRLLPFAEEALRLMAAARAAVAEEGEPAGPLLIGSLETTAALRLSRPMASFVARCPGVDLTLRTGTSEEMVQAVLARQVDGAFVCAPVTHPDLAARPMFTERLAIAVAAARQGVAEAELQRAGERIVVLKAGCSYRQRLEEMLAKRGAAGLRRIELGTIEAVIGCVAAGLGITLLPEAILAPAVAEGRVALYRPAPTEAVVETLFVQRRDTRPSRAMDAFLAEIESTPARLAAE